MIMTSTGVSEPITSTPLLCGDTSAPTVVYGQVSPLYYSPNGVTSLKPFVFGASATDPTTPASARGASMSFDGSTMRVLGDPALVCYGLDANGVNGPTPGVMRDQFEGPNYSPTQKISFNSSVVLTVFHVPTSPTDFYGYTIDVTIPQLPASYASMCLPPVGTGTAPNGIDCNFALIEGFDTSFFEASAGLATSGQWCLAPAGVQSCASPAPPGGTTPAFGDININYSNYAQTGISLGASIAPAPAKQFHFVAFRKFASNVTSLSAVTSPLVITALFSPFDLDENFIGDNVSAGYANSPPAVVQSGDAWTVFSGKLGALAENTDSGSLSFNITDSDTPETGSTLKADVTLNLAGLQIPVTPNCTLTSAGGTPVNRTCTIDVNFADPNWWNASVGAAYQGQGNLFATDPGGVGASASIVAMDAAGKSSAAVNVPIHVQSKVNSAPLVAFGGVMPSAPDSKQGGTSYPTYSCSVAANNCGGTFNVVQMNGVISALPGPAAAFDELASQTTDVNSVVCGQSGEQDAIFVNQPVAELSAPTSFDLLFQLKTPLVTGSSLCTVTITDQMAVFPAGESAQISAKQFRIVVTP
ncbi:MAG TPA: hypothetical protein VFI49_13755 [Rudaea sp.]|nr:hypothetical protein [Rudaea sp.]